MGKKKTSAPPSESSTVEKKTPHLAKVEKFMAGLPSLSEQADEVFNVARDLSTADINVLIAHLNAVTRVRGVTESANAPKLVVGQSVRIVAGNPKFIGMEGTLEKVARIRCHVSIPGYDKAAYFFNCEVEPIGEILRGEEDDESQDSEELVDATTPENSDDEQTARTGTEG